MNSRIAVAMFLSRASPSACAHGGDRRISIIARITPHIIARGTGSERKSSARFQIPRTCAPHGTSRAHPHHVGASTTRERRMGSPPSSGIWPDTHIEQFDVLFPTPKERAVELVEGGPKFAAKLQSQPYSKIPRSSQQSESCPLQRVFDRRGGHSTARLRETTGFPKIRTAERNGRFC